MAGNSTYKSRKKDKLCVDCGKQPAMPGFTRCKGCLRIAAVEQKGIREKSGAKGLCTYCGKRPAAPILGYCSRCALQKMTEGDQENLEKLLYPDGFTELVSTIESDGESDGLTAKQIRAQVDQVKKLYQRLAQKHPRITRRLPL